MPSLRLRTKLILFAVVIALIPIAIAGRTLIRITEGERRPGANQHKREGQEQRTHRRQGSAARPGRRD